MQYWTASGSHGDADPAPYFFLSYAHVHPNAYTNDDLDRDALRLYRDVCSHIMQMTDFPHAKRPGFMDRKIDGGTRWDDDIKWGLASSRVFVALCGPRYFSSDYCGKEWDAFSRREALHLENSERRSARRAIIPIRWTPFEMETAPRVIQEHQHFRFDHDSGYLELGLYGLLKSKHEREYVDATLQITRAILRTARETAIAPCDPKIFVNLRNVFKDDPEASRDHPDTGDGE
ncbi:toll/interleukin-1 receptor domain-containing protein [Streptosporangiaceae bacterium NEAU-GS5]|nr:toll/interleukin-1 receptor domain-containing protein [Streptosporangiaceae bacterium NEAU-GS5]